MLQTISCGDKTMFFLALYSPCPLHTHWTSSYHCVAWFNHCCHCVSPSLAPVLASVAVDLLWEGSICSRSRPAFIKPSVLQQPGARREARIRPHSCVRRRSLFSILHMPGYAKALVEHLQLAIKNTSFPITAEKKKRQDL